MTSHRRLPLAPGSRGGGDPHREVIEGIVERITYHNDENGYTVARLNPGGTGKLVTVVGHMHSLNVGAGVKLWGRWTTHAQYGRQFTVDEYREKLPATLEGIRKYLGSGLIKGIGPVTAKRIVDHFGLETLEIIEDEPRRLVEVPNVGEVRAGIIAQAWEAQKQIKAIMLFLQSHDITTGLAVKIYKRYGEQSIGIVRQDPYRLAREVYGVGFLTADRIARSLGIAPDSPARIEAGILYTLDRLAGEGHVFAPRRALADETVRLLEVDPAAVGPAVDRLAAAEALVIETLEPGEASLQAVYLTPFHRAEAAIAHRLRRMMEEPASRLGAFRTITWDTAFQWLDRRLPDPLAERQREAVVTALTRKVSVLTGGPGTGKTTTVRAVLALLETRGGSTALPAPTGRAAKRLEETTGVAAKTIHRLLEFKPSQGFHFERNTDNPVDADLVVIDEVSMVDCLLMNALTRALDPMSHLLLVGDADQLPSVGAGNVLRDLIASGVVPTVTLDQIFRQARQSLIVVNAHRINNGDMPILARGQGDFFLFRVEDQEAAAERVVDVVANRIPSRFGFDPVDEIQVLSPMHRGAAGVTALNARLREALNPPSPDKPEARIGDRSFRLGDKVMQIRNNYTKDVYNGDLGRIVELDSEDHMMTVAFDERRVAYEFNELDELMHAFACSTHKSQGAEYPAVVMALLPAHFMMLQRNLLYTGVTRARRLCVIVGSPRAIGMAVGNDRVAARHTYLAGRLRRALSPLADADKKYR